MIGRTIGHYQIVAELGVGGMGTVYRADDLRLQRPVAIKFVSPHLSRDPESHQRLLREARSASALDHPHIGVVHEVAETDDGQLYIVMALYEGGTLRQRLDQGSLPIDEALRLGRQITEGLTAAHAAGIVHRDLKPENILLTRDGQVRIVDFGLAKSRGQTRMTRTGSAAGTVAYMSPEQARGDEVDARTDLFSLGVILYEMLGGRPPFRGESDSAVLYQVVHEEPPALEELRAEVPRSLRKMVTRLLAKEPSGRYENAPAVLADLGSGRVRRRWPRRRALLAAAGAIAILGLMTWWAWPRYLSETARFKREIVQLQDDKRPLVIAVAPFAATGAEAVSRAGMLRSVCIQELNKFLGSYDKVQLHATGVDVPVRTHAEALALAIKQGADVVLWGELAVAGDSLQLQPYLTATQRALMSQSALTGESTLAMQSNLRMASLPATARGLRSLAALSAAGFYARMNQGTQALALLDTISEQSFDVVVARLEIMRTLGRQRESAGLALQSLTLWPNASALLMERGYALEDLGNLEAAAEIYRSVADRDSTDSKAANAVGAVCRQEGRFAEATVWYARARLHAQESSQQSLAEGGLACLELGDYEGAQVLYEKAVRYNRFDRRPRTGLGRTLIYLGEYEEARRQFEVLKLLYPKAVYVRHHLARALVGCRRILEAGALCRSPDVEHPNLHDLSGRLYLLERNWEMARREFGIASRGSPSVIYPVILNWLAVRGVHGERQAIKESASGFALCKTDDYGAALLAYFQGDADEEAVLSATASDDGDIRNKRLCEASYYMGMRHLLAAEAGGPQAEQELSFAFQYLQRCLDTGVKGYNEYLFARLELKRLRRN